mmetsp:Transcript_17667/g.41052  ORF Transcript_17667/g.41052 Transcript_17667/m.41052 type:complete len:258 (-) Transcript_17667:67-840(-)
MMGRNGVLQCLPVCQPSGIIWTAPSAQECGVHRTRIQNVDPDLLARILQSCLARETLHGPLGSCVQGVAQCCFSTDRCHIDDDARQSSREPVGDLGMHASKSTLQVDFENLLIAEMAIRLHEAIHAKVKSACWACASIVDSNVKAAVPASCKFQQSFDLGVVSDICHHPSHAWERILAKRRHHKGSHSRCCLPRLVLAMSRQCDMRTFQVKGLSSSIPNAGITTGNENTLALKPRVAPSRQVLGTCCRHCSHQHQHC